MAAYKPRTAGEQNLHGQNIWDSGFRISDLLIAESCWSAACCKPAFKSQIRIPKSQIGFALFAGHLIPCWISLCLNAAMEDVTAFVLAGGRSTRMGTDKAFLDFQGKTLLARALEVAAAVAGRVLIVGSRSKFTAYAPAVEDIYVDRGPLGGIHTALSVTATDLNVILAVDQPFLTSEFLRYLLQRARMSGAMVTVARTGGGLQPLGAVYRRAFRHRAEEALGAGQNKIDPLFSPADTLVLEEAELAQLSFPAAIFDNLNTRQEYDRLTKDKS